MIKFLLIFLTFQTCGESSCDVKEEQLKIAIRALYSRGLLEIENDTLGLQVYNNLTNTDIDVKPLDKKQVLVKEKAINLEMGYVDGSPLLRFKGVIPSKEYEDERFLLFEVLKQGSKHSGKIVLNCENGELFFKDISYITTIE